MLRSTADCLLIESRTPVLPSPRRATNLRRVKFPRLCPALGLLLLLVAAAPARAQNNDNFVGRLPLTGTTASAVSNNLHATHEPGEPNHGNSGGARSLWWTWTAPATGLVNFSAYSGWDMPLGVFATAPSRTLAVYTGSAITALSEVASASTPVEYFFYDPYARQTAAGPSFNVQVTAGTTYQIVVDAPAYLSAADDGTVIVTINQTPSIYSAAGASGAVGSSFSYSILASNNPTVYNATNLPAGLSLNPYTGDITGTPQAAGVYAIGLTASNPGGTGSATLNLAVAIPTPAAATTAPVISSSAMAGGMVGAQFSYYLSASGNPTGYTASGLPGGLSIDTNSGLISGTPTTSSDFIVPVTATNAAGTGSASVTIHIAAGAHLPAIVSSLAATGTVGSSFYYSISTDEVSTIDDPTSYGATNLPPGLGFDASDGELQGTPTAAGVYRVPMTATNAAGTGSAVVTITISAAAPVGGPQAAPPLLTSSATAGGVVGTAFTYQLTATNAPASFAASSLPPGLSLNSQNGYLTGTPLSTGVFLVPVTAANAYGSCAATLMITVAANATAASINTPLVITSAAEVSNYVGGYVYYQLAASSPSGEYYPYYGSAVYSAGNLPPGLSINPTYGWITGTPAVAGTYATEVSVAATNVYIYPQQYVGGSAVVTFIIGNAAPSSPVTIPVFNSAASAVGAVGSTFTGYTASASGSPTAYSASNLPPGLSLNATSGAVTGTPNVAGTYQASFTAANSAGTGSATVTFVIAGVVATAAPVISSSAIANGTVGSSFSYSISASNSPTAYGASNLPAGLSVSTTSGTIKGKPTSAGIFTVPISATNAGGTSGATLTIIILAGTSVPVISSSVVAQGTVGASFSYSIAASPSPTSYSASNLPPGLSLGATSGTIAGTPTASGVYTVPIAATDTAGTGSATLTITIAAGPAAPVLSGNAATSATLGSAFSYSISASNSPTGYTAGGLPNGLSLNATSGAITGTPTAAGVYTVPISATNSGGSASATLTINVATASPPLPPVVSSAVSAAGLVGAGFSYAITASNTPTSFDLGASLPPGLNFSPVTGLLSGTPTAAGTYTLPISASNAAGTGRAKLTLSFAAQPTAIPVVSSAAGVDGRDGQAFNYTIAASNSPTTFTASNLPPGLSLNTATGLITGTPTTTGTYSVPVSAANSVGTGAATLTFNISSATYGRVTSPLAASGIKSAAFSYTLTTDVSAYAYSVSSLPPGLSFNASTHQIAGTPTATGTFTSPVSVSTSYGTISATLSISIVAAATSVPVLTSSAGALGYYGEPFYYALTATNSPTSYSVGTLPAGLSYDAIHNVISGMPTVTGGTYSVAIKAANGTGSGNGTLTVAIYQGAPERVASAAGANALVGSPFNYLLAANLGTYTYNYSATGLPPGVSINTYTGQISGTPTEGGIYAVPLAISGSGSATATLTISVDAAPTAPPVLTCAAEATGVLGAPFLYALAAANLPTAFSATNLPGGLSFDASANVISGVPTAAGTFSVPVSATNAAGTASTTVTLAVATAPPAAPVLTSDSLAATATVGSSGVFYQIQATNQPTSYAANGLPPGLSVDVGDGDISGTPTAAGLYSATIFAANAAGSSSAVVTFTIGAGSVPVFSSFQATYTGNVGQSFEQSIYGSNSPTSYAASGLPPGLYLNVGTGEIYGTPMTAGTYSAVISLANAFGSSQATLTFAISGAAVPSFSGDNATAAGNVGASFNQSFSASYAASYVVSGLPPGLSYSFYPQSDVSIQGTPTVAGVYPVTITASSVGGTASEVITITVGAASTAVPVITSAAGATGGVGGTFSYQISASNSPTSYTASGLPSGLLVNPATGTISGIPTTAGSYSVELAATNANGTGSAFVTLQIASTAPAASTPPVITSAAAAYYDGGSLDPFDYLFEPQAETFTYTITAGNAPTSFGASNLPAGLAINPCTGVISGQPQVAGTFAVPISATNAAGTANAVLTIIAPATAPTLQASLATSGVIGAPFDYQLDPGDEYEEDAFFGIVAPVAPTYAAVGLPPGLSLNATTGEITGTPSQAGSFPTTLSASNLAGSSSVVVTFVVAATATAATVAPPTFYGEATAVGFVGSPLNQYLSGTGTSYAAGSLPAGLSLNSTTGLMSGVPTAAGLYAVPVSTTGTGGTANAVLTIAILAAPDAPLISSSAGATATVGAPFGYSIYANSTDFTPTPTSYGADNLPPGLSLNPTNGYISGTPTQAGTSAMLPPVRHAAKGAPLGAAKTQTVVAASKPGGSGKVSPRTAGTQAGTYAVTISATSAGVTSHAVLTLTVQPAPATAAAPSAPLFAGPAGVVGFVGEPFTYPGGLEGFSPSDALPGGLNFNGATDAISGYPAADGVFDVALSSSNAGGTGDASVNFRLVAPELSLPRLVSPPVGVTVAQGAGATLLATATGAPAPTFQWAHDGTVVPGAIGPQLNFSAAQPADAGMYVVTVSNSSGNVTSAAVALKVIQTYANWQSTYFSPQEITAGLAAEGYDFNGDGLPNLLEYALGRDPRNGSGGSMPAVSIPLGGTLQIQFSRDSGKTDLAYIVDASSDLQTWTAIAQSTAGGAMSNLGSAGQIVETATAGGLVNVTVQDGQALGVSGSRFLRLRVIGQ